MSASGVPTDPATGRSRADAGAAWMAHYAQLCRRYRDSEHRRRHWLSLKRRRRVWAALLTTGVMSAAAVIAFLIALLSAP
jgi:hypothetical protein